MTVTWKPRRCIPFDLATEAPRRRVTDPGEHHLVPADTPVTEAVVTAISAVHCAYAPKPGATSPTMYAVEGSAVLSPVESAERWTKNLGDRKFVGYLVHLRTS
ncbi:DUF6578 domain-containing protein [Nonomuraea africana]|uniref:DUF6578 domain-containing protein n=1 Tax=Nonomuraea africana TaxID=46171 RepID=UPI0033D646D0